VRRLAPALLLLLVATVGADADDAADVNEECLACHADPDLSTTLGDGALQSLTVDPAAYAASKHARRRCTDCHPGFEEQPHPAWDTSSRPAYRATYHELCKRCHPQQHARAEDGVHFRLLAQGDQRAPFCTDCHGVHDIEAPDEPRSRISRTCGRCHTAVAAVYAESVHGRALLGSGDPDVPVCTDCHRPHDIADPSSRAWKLGTPDTCARCHGDPAVAARHGMSPNVIKTYLADFHGMTASLQRRQAGGAPGVATALCVDCHGIHDIVKVDAASSPVVRERLVQTCRKCHGDATDSFPAAWMSHYDPSFERSPLVAGVLFFYRLIIPYIVGGLLLQVGIHAWSLFLARRGSVA
jgi:hypothetical protein